MPIFQLGRAFLDKSHMWKFGSDWLNLSRVIMVTYKKMRLKTISLQNFHSVWIIIASKAFRLISCRRGLTIIESIWNSGNRPYLVAITYVLNFIKIRGIWFFRGQKPPIRGLTIVERSWNYGNLPYLVANTYGLNFIKIGGIWILLWCPFLNSDALLQSEVMCENLVLIGWNQRYVNFEGWRNPLLGVVVTCDLRCPFSNLAELFQSKVMSENLVWIGWAFQELSCPQTEKK